MNDLGRIADYLPHRAPFRFVSTVTNLEAGVAGSGTWCITGDEDFFKGHFPGEPVVPGVLLAESLAQLAGLVGFADHAAQGVRVRLARVDVKFTSQVKPPAVVVLWAMRGRSIGSLAQFEVSARSGDKTVASGTITLASIPFLEAGAES